MTNRGGRTCHAAIVSRELGVPCIVGTKDATEKLKTGVRYTIDCSKGSTGLVYDGDSKIERTSVDIDSVPKTETEIKLILGDPSSGKFSIDRKFDTSNNFIDHLIRQLSFV